MTKTACVGEKVPSHPRIMVWGRWWMGEWPVSVKSHKGRPSQCAEGQVGGAPSPNIGGGRTRGGWKGPFWGFVSRQDS